MSFISVVSAVVVVVVSSSLPSAYARFKKTDGHKLNGSSHSFAIIGDAGEWTPLNKQVRDSILKAQVNDLILPGDNLYHERDTYQKTWEPWTRHGFDFPVVAIGNHNGGYSEETKFFRMPGEHYVYSPSARAQFIILNSDNMSNVDEQLRWLNDTLKSSKAEIIFLVYHHPSLTITFEHNWRERMEFQLGVRSLIGRYRKKITAILNGHDHIAELLHFDDLPVVISGATHEVRGARHLDETQQGIHVKTEWLFDENPTWVRLDLPPDGVLQPEVRMQFIRATDGKTMCSVRIFTGRAADIGDDCRKNDMPDQRRRANWQNETD